MALLIIYPLATFLFDQVIFGPVRSRRLGLSLGVNLLPNDGKLCNFDCIYCECGWGAKGVRTRFNSREEVRTLLREKLREMVGEGTLPDVITFAGNGEPTMHPEFEQIIDDTIEIRDELCPATKISVLSNATMIESQSVRRALGKVDNNILKIDSAFEETIKLINNPKGDYSLARTLEMMKLFDGKFIIQTMFLRGVLDGKKVDNTTSRQITGWLAMIDDMRPSQVMIYSIDRDTPASDLEKVPLEELREIARKVEALDIPYSVAE